MLDVFGNVVSLDAVSAGKGARKCASGVGKAYCGTVKLKLAAVAERTVEGLVCPCGKFFDLGNAVGIAKREHRIAVRTLHEIASHKRLCVLTCRSIDVTAHRLGRGVGSKELRISLFKRLQFMHQEIIFLIAHCRGVVNIVFPAVLFQDRLQFKYAFLGFNSIHTCAGVHIKFTNIRFFREIIVIFVGY